MVYLIDVRRVLHPPSDEPLKVDWSTVGVFDDDRTSLAPDGGDAPRPRLDQCDIDIVSSSELYRTFEELTRAQMRRLEERVNVLPVLARTDTLTLQELDQVREVVRADLERAFPHHGGFGVFADPDEDDGRRVRSSCPFPACELISCRPRGSEPRYRKRLRLIPVHLRRDLRSIVRPSSTSSPTPSSRLLRPSRAQREDSRGNIAGERPTSWTPTRAISWLCARRSWGHIQRSCGIRPGRCYTRSIGRRSCSRSRGRRVGQVNRTPS